MKCVTLHKNIKEILVVIIVGVFQLLVGNLSLNVLSSHDRCHSSPDIEPGQGRWG